MRYIKMKRVIIALTVLLAIVAVAGLASADNFPSQEQRASAEKTAQLMHNELFAALITEFNETTPENVEEGKQAISLIFNNANRDIRLIGIVPPLQGGFNNLPSDPFERRAMTRAPGPGDYVSRAHWRSLVLSALRSSQQHFPPELRAMPSKLCQLV